MYLKRLASSFVYSKRNIFHEELLFSVQLQSSQINVTCTIIIKLCGFWGLKGRVLITCSVLCYCQFYFMLEYSGGIISNPEYNYPKWSVLSQHTNNPIQLLTGRSDLRFSQNFQILFPILFKSSMIYICKDSYFNVKFDENLGIFGGYICIFFLLILSSYVIVK